MGLSPHQRRARDAIHRQKQFYFEGETDHLVLKSEEMIRLALKVAS
jgi:hypothetical protein